ncbi:Stk1 family PASTA domain-containing Ser/Thr kinase [Paenibacillus thalictri]|uniref:PASTA domain-containing protein n=1 Tax=Paenibacillus thalictri TaxID=2527873 RepID=A0A4V2J3V0_9BACL|nr:Stk1 family PASTA domain-containing Ser/Thr kinase [Paenibacillus thalictri]TBL75694.1 PASTA domain-containing protein [Paenibacillus thalictri]
MEPVFDKRYELLKQSIQLPDGSAMWKGKDNALHRDAIFIISEITDRSRDLNPIGLAGQLPDGGFLHILDAEIQPGYRKIVLKNLDGGPLLNQIEKHSFSFDQVIAMVLNLGEHMRAAAAEHISGYAVSAGNLWLNGFGELMVINFWTEGALEEREAAGLCSLLYQLAARSRELPALDEAADMQPAGLPAGWSDRQCQALFAMLREAVRGQISLASLLMQLQVLKLSYSEPTDMTETVIMPPVVETPRLAQEKPKQQKPQPRKTVKREEPDRDEALERKGVIVIPKSWVLLGIPIAGIVGVVVVIVLLSNMPMQSFRDKETQPSATAAPVEKPKPASETAMKPQTERPKKEISAVAAEKPADAEPADVPPITGLAREEAEKALLAAGFRYNYKIESNAQLANGTVFKQEPEAHTASTKGSSVTFWVSKQN